MDAVNGKNVGTKRVRSSKAAKSGAHTTMHKEQSNPAFVAAAEKNAVAVGKATRKTVGMAKDKAIIGLAAVGTGVVLVGAIAFAGYRGFFRGIRG